MNSAFICDYVRTPIGRYGGGLSPVRTDDLAAIPIRHLVEKNTNINWECLDEVILGCANQAGEDNRNVARMATLLAGLPQTVPAITLNRLCASGMDAVSTAARIVRCGEADLIIAGGIESMSRAPLVMPKADAAFSRRADIYDTTIGWRFVNPKIEAEFGIDSMPETAENVASEFSVSREAQDVFALQSQTRAETARTSGRLAKEIVPVSIVQRKAPDVVISHDEHPRQTSLEKLAALRAPFRENGSVTAGNASGVNDGAAALIIASEAAIAKYGLSPMAEIIGASSSGVSPRIMGIGPITSTEKLSKLIGTKPDQFDLYEINEAFAAQAIAVCNALNIDPLARNVNPNGGAIALGHPLGMTGARLVGTAATELQLGSAITALCSMCVGVGQGVSLALRRVSG